jgi:REP element-mobilizing transposase RayT
VIIRGIERRPIVDDDKDRENFVSRLGRLTDETDTGIFAWTLMTNHAHILIKSGSYGLPNFMLKLHIENHRYNFLTRGCKAQSLFAVKVSRQKGKVILEDVRV